MVIRIMKMFGLIDIMSASVSKLIGILRDCVDGISVCMYMGSHSVLRSNSKLHDSFGKMQTHARLRMPRIILVNAMIK